MSFGEHTFFRIDKLSLNEKKSLLLDCKELSYEWWVDKLDCSKSLARQKIDFSFEAILEKLSDKAHVVVIDRGRWGDYDNREHFEVGFCSMESPIDYFLFIEIDSDKMPQILNKYSLEPM